MTAPDFRAWRLAAGVSQHTLAVLLGVTRGAISHWEHGRCPISGRTLTALRYIATINGWPRPTG